MNVNEIKFRCSSLSHIMTEPRTKSEGLSETAKTHCIDVFVSWKYNRFTDTTSKYIEKGNNVEEDSITVVSRITKDFWIKNDEFLENDFIKGTPDLYKGTSIYNADVVRDTKSAWDIYTFWRSKKKIKPSNEYQIKGYMWLSGANEGYVDYCLNNTPFESVIQELWYESKKHPDNNTPAWIELQIIANHVYDKKSFDEYIHARGIVINDLKSKAVYAGFVEVPISERHFCFHVERNEEDFEKIQNRVIECREFIKTLI